MRMILRIGTAIGIAGIEVQRLPFVVVVIPLTTPETSVEIQVESQP